MRNIRLIYAQIVTHFIQMTIEDNQYSGLLCEKTFVLFRSPDSDESLGLVLFSIVLNYLWVAINPEESHELQINGKLLFSGFVSAVHTFFVCHDIRVKQVIRKRHKIQYLCKCWSESVFTQSTQTFASLPTKQKSFEETDNREKRIVVKLCLEGVPNQTVITVMKFSQKSFDKNRK